NATSASGTANIAGGGIANLSGRLTLERTVVAANRGGASGAGGLALGGGVLNIDFGGGAPQLSVADSVITANALTADAGTTPHGGGISTADLPPLAPVPSALTRRVMEGNKPDQWGGCWGRRPARAGGETRPRRLPPLLLPASSAGEMIACRSGREVPG